MISLCPKCGIIYKIEEDTDSREETWIKQEKICDDCGNFNSPVTRLEENYK